MRRIFSEVHKRTLLRTIWIALARAQMRVGLVTEEQLAELEATKDRIDIARATQIESEIHHDLMAEIHTWAEQCPNGEGSSTSEPPAWTSWTTWMPFGSQKRWI